MQRLEQNVSRIKKDIQKACDKANRSLDSVKTIVVTKNRNHDEIQAMYRLGFRHFAENRVDKLLLRQKDFPQEDIIWHLIGPLQKRKVKDIIHHIDYFHALDKISIANEIQKRSTKPVKVFIELNISNEETKHGFLETEWKLAIRKILTMDKIHIVGLMTMAPFEAPNTEIRQYFRQLAQIRDELLTWPEFQRKLLELSMGMSQDFELAIEEGATYLRIGTGWFDVND